MGHIDHILSRPQADTALCGSPPRSSQSRASHLRAIIASACEVGAGCPPHLAGGLLARVGRAAAADPDDPGACAHAAFALVEYLTEHGVAAFALTEADLISGSATAQAKLRAVNAAMARLADRAEALRADALGEGGHAPPAADWRPIDIGEARVLRGVLSSARIRGRLQS